MFQFKKNINWVPTSGVPQNTERCHIRQDRVNGQELILQPDWANHLEASGSCLCCRWVQTLGPRLWVEPTRCFLVGILTPPCQVSWEPSFSLSPGLPCVWPCLETGNTCSALSDWLHDFFEQDSGLYRATLHMHVLNLICKCGDFIVTSMRPP